MGLAQSTVNNQTVKATLLLSKSGDERDGKLGWAIKNRCKTAKEGNNGGNNSGLGRDGKHRLVC